MNSRQTSLRLEFKKVGVQRFLSHLDLMRLFHKAFRRAMLPLARSRGRVPTPRIRIPYPLPLGVESTRDVLMADLTVLIHPDDVKQRLNRKLPEGVVILSARLASAGERWTLSGLRYTVTGAGLPARERLEAFMDSTTHRVERKRNERLVSLDIRPFVESLRRTRGGEIVLDLRVVDGRSTRPDEVLGALGADRTAVAGFRIVRTGVREVCA